MRSFGITRLGRFSSAVAASVIIMAGLSGHAAADCKKASGEIFNNAQPGGNTLGVVHMKLRGKKVEDLGTKKFKCGIVGESQPEGSPINFLHTVVCDNETSDDEAQAQVTLATYFADSDFTPCSPHYPHDPRISGSFVEHSVPLPHTARGGFRDITDEGTLTITGDINCDGGIVMKFEGEICFAD